MALYKNNGLELKRFSVGDLVYDEFYGTGIVFELDLKFDEMQVRFHRPETNVWLTPKSVRSLTIISKARDRKRMVDISLTQDS